ncbi:hypothetical protein E2L08_01635 [Palleronia sediminis]|uniref:Uncharacterized protein n=1 Tax=Palleronia sediminis TaxID=2547833 RepID=A0A4R6AR40_9RHOB|nr:hypothetical protein [Palleronia sediminis]TDL84193.1 hypothetical protein E2L08_01635 [Palleronia sediminis]
MSHATRILPLLTAALAVMAGLAGATLGFASLLVVSLLLVANAAARTPERKPVRIRTDRK